MSTVENRTITGHLNTAVTPKNSWQRYPSIWSILGSLFTLYLIYAFFSGQTFKFYASFLFLFYSVTKKMWVSVVMLGIFQTLLMIPLRAINIRKSNHIKEFSDKLKEIEEEGRQSFVLKKSIQSGDRTAIFYWLNFIIQAISYLSLGRLFLTDFYRVRLDPSRLYDFVQYPQYPIQSVIFKIPYVWAKDTKDLGLQAVVIAWVFIILLQAGIYLVRKARSYFKKRQGPAFVSKIGQYITGSTLILCVLAWILIRNFPTSIGIFIFSGDITQPYPTFNFITAIATFITVIWLKVPRILTKTELAKEAGIDAKTIYSTQKDMFSNTLRNATIIGLGAYFITNQIPSAFELSIFTLEVISLAAPLTLDKVITSFGKNKIKSTDQESSKTITEDQVSSDELPKSNTEN